MAAHFNNCWVTESGELCEVVINNVTFKMRAITAGEFHNMYSTCRLADIGGTAVDKYTNIDFMKLQTMTVATALGAFKKIGGEGWTDDREVTFENIELLRQGIVTQLYEEHDKFFRNFTGDNSKHKPND